MTKCKGKLVKVFRTELTGRSVNTKYSFPGIQTSSNSDNGVNTEDKKKGNKPIIFTFFPL